MSVRLYVEGGGDRNSKIACRDGFRSFVRKAGAEGRMPKIIASGSRDEAYGDFKAAHAQRSDTAMLLVDAEEEVTASSAWAHLRSRDNWRRPTGATNDQCHLMVQVMESWFPCGSRGACDLLPAAIPAAGAARESQAGRTDL